MSQLQLFETLDDVSQSSQRVFRQLLKAMSEPGTVQTIEAAPATDTHGVVHSSTWVVAQTLLDASCQVAILPSLDQPGFTQSLQFYTDAKVIDDLPKAQFAFLSIDELLNLESVNQGTLMNPHHSCTLIVQVDDISTEPQLQLSGPGIVSTSTLTLAGLSNEHIEYLQHNHQQYPCGIDFIFCSPKNIAALPRTTAIATHSLAREVA